MEKWNLILLNGDERCTGEFTRIEGKQKSAIDFILVNQAIYGSFKNMHIDEEKERCDISGHCLIEALFEVDERDKETGRKNKIIENEYYRVNFDESRKTIIRKMISAG